MRRAIGAPRHPPSDRPSERQIRPSPGAQNARRDAQQRALARPVWPHDAGHALAPELQPGDGERPRCRRVAEPYVAGNVMPSRLLNESLRVDGLRELPPRSADARARDQQEIVRSGR